MQQVTIFILNAILIFICRFLFDKKCIKKFLMYALRRSISRDSHLRLPSYIGMCELIGMETLARRRTNACVFDLLKEYYNEPNPLLHVVINQPSSFSRQVQSSADSVSIC